MVNKLVMTDLIGSGTSGEVYNTSDNKIVAKVILDTPHLRKEVLYSKLASLLKERKISPCFLTFHGVISKHHKFKKSVITDRHFQSFKIRGRALALFFERAGPTLECFELSKLHAEMWKSIYAHLSFALIALQQRVYIGHNDLIPSNVTLQKTTMKFISYVYKKKYYKVPTYGYLPQIIDFGLSYSSWFDERINPVSDFNNLVKRSDAPVEYVNTLTDAVKKFRTTDIEKGRVYNINEDVFEEVKELYENLLI
jgi:hypothetical protein